MSRPLKSWQGWIVCPLGVNARHPDGRFTIQVEAAVRATSQRAAAEALNVTLGHMRSYMSETGNAACLAALDQYEPGTVLLHPIDPGGTVNGQDGWIPLPKDASD